MARAVPPRNEIAIEHTWDVTSVFASDAAWEAEITRVIELLPQLAAFQGRLTEGPATLTQYFAAYDDVVGRALQIYLYAEMYYNVDTSDQQALARADRATGIFSRVLATTAFAEPELLAIGFPTVRRWIGEEPRLAYLAHYLDQLEQRQQHVRSAEVEELLGQALDPFASATTIHAVLADADLRFAPVQPAEGEPIPVAQGNIDALLADPDREVRRQAWEHYADAHLAVKNTMALCLATGVKQNVFQMRARRYPSALEAAVESNFIPVEVFHNLIATFRRHLPTWHRYWRVRRQALGYDQLHPYDVHAPLTTEQVDVQVDQAIDWIAAGMQPLGDEYVTIMRNGIGRRWVDLYPNQGKRMGAFSTGVRGSEPFILMNYTDDLSSMSTLAHELGHSMHSYYTWANQPLIYSNYSIFVAEVASNFNQALVRDYLLKQGRGREFEIGVIEEAMANFHRYFFIMPTLARFELEIHERAERGEGLTSDGMIELMAELFREAYGDEVVIDDARVGSTWCQFSTHLYANFYVYQYATGISAAHALAQNILEGKPDAAERYLAFLKAGSAGYPLDVLKLAGVDMTTPEPVEQAFGVLARYVDRLEELTSQY